MIVSLMLYLDFSGILLFYPGGFGCEIMLATWDTKRFKSATISARKVGSNWQGRS
jgi:hypothetical protein